MLPHAVLSYPPPQPPDLWPPGLALREEMVARLSLAGATPPALARLQTEGPGHTLVQKRTYRCVPHGELVIGVVNSRCHTQEMDQIRLCDIGRRDIGPTVRSVDRVLENSSEVGEKADYPIYQPFKKELDYGVHGCIYIITGFRPSPLP